MDVDVAIIGGGPAGATAGTLLRKYAPQLSVAIFERENFPRDHVGESQLPPISKVLAEMGCWDKIEAAGFPIKIGATYRWGTTDDLWDFEFVPEQEFLDAPRPAKYEGQRLLTAFQVDRAIYDKILLDHARAAGCRVMENTGVRSVSTSGDRVEGLELSDGTPVKARHYIDASGHSGILRRAVGVEVQAPTSLQNIAIWDYWQNAEWAVNIGVGGTRVYVLSLGYGWIWFIPLGPTRTSIGLIVPAEYFRQQSKSPSELYAEALAAEPRIKKLIANATSEDRLATTKDWSFLADRTCGENWFLAGESAGFADPILAAGMTLAHLGARECAFSIMELERRVLEPGWIKAAYDDLQRRRIGQHIRFADYWYSANGQFTDLKEYCTEIAKDAGLSLAPDQAFQWLGTGGFANEDLNVTAIGVCDVRALRLLTQHFSDDSAEWGIAAFNHFALNLDGATKQWLPKYVGGRVERVRAYVRDGKRLPQTGGYQAVTTVLGVAPDLPRIMVNLEVYRQKEFGWYPADEWRILFFQFLEAMLAEGWVVGTLDESLPRLKLRDETLNESTRSKFAVTARQS